MAKESKQPWRDEEIFHGRPVLILGNSEDDKYKVKLGLYKAELILRGIERIKVFIKMHEKPE